MDYNNYRDYSVTNRPVSGVEGVQTPSDYPEGREDGSAKLAQMNAGETVQGEVIGVKGNEVQVLLEGNTVITAQLAKDIQVLLGQNLIFEVQNGGSSQITLRALFTNTAEGKLLANALTAAELPVTKETLSLVENMIREELPIDKQSLQTVYRESLEFPGLKGEALVKMHKLELPVNESTVKQFTAFLNSEEQIANTTKEIIDLLPREIETLLQSGDSSKAFVLGKEVLNLLSASKYAESAQIFLKEGMTLQGRSPLTLPLEFAFTQDGLNGSGGTVGDAFLLQELVSHEQKEVLSLFAGQSKENITAGEFFNLLLKGVEEELLPKEKLGELFKESAFKELVGKELSKLWLLNPQDKLDGKSVSDLYNRLNQHVNLLTQNAAESLASSQNVNQALNGLKENVDFLNQLNQIVPYVQLPLKLNGKAATGDLYVFADRKSLAEQKENITAALHLDMENLGHLDVFIRLNVTKVNTEFKVESEEVLDFLVQHIDVLNERLKKRGYDMEVDMKLYENPSAVKDDLFAKKTGEETQDERKPLLYNRFDLRA